METVMNVVWVCFLWIYAIGFCGFLAAWLCFIVWLIWDNWRNPGPPWPGEDLEYYYKSGRWLFFAFGPDGPLPSTPYIPPKWKKTKKKRRKKKRSATRNSKPEFFYGCD